MGVFRLGKDDETKSINLFVLFHSCFVAKALKWPTIRRSRAVYERKMTMQPGRLYFVNLPNLFLLP